MPVLDDTSGTGTVGTATNTTADTGSSWSDIMSKFSDSENDPMKLAMLFIIGNYINQKNSDNGITATDALTGSTSKGLTGIQSKYNTMNTALQNQLSGQTANSDVANVRNLLTQRANTNTGITPALMAAMQNTALNGNQNSTIQWGNNILQNSLANRMGTRALQNGTGSTRTSGALTPLQLPTGATKLF